MAAENVPGAGTDFGRQQSDGWDSSLNGLLNGADDTKPNERYLYLNPAQVLVYNFASRHTTVEAARGTGKTDSMIAPFQIRVTQSMPGGSGIFLGNSVKQLYSRTVPVVIAALEKLGFKEGQHFVRGRAPAKCNFKMPYVRPQRWDNVLHFYNGFVWYLSSTAVLGSVNGMSVFSIIADEAKFISERKFNEEVLATLRGASIKTDHPGFNDKLNPFCKSTFLVSDAPSTPRQAWLYKRKALDTDKVNSKIVEMLSELMICPDLMDNNNFVKLLNKLRCASSAYFRFSTLENIDLLGEPYIKQMKRTMPKFVFDISILNKETDTGGDGYYFNYNPDVHEYSNSDESQLEVASRYRKKMLFRNDRGEKIETEGVDFEEISQLDNCIFDTDIRPGEPLRIAFDYNANVNSMVIGQTPSRMSRSAVKVVKSLIVRNKRKLEALLGDFCRYYAPHQDSCNEVIFYYDSTAKQGASYASENADDTRFVNIVCKVLRKNKWKVTEVDLGRPMEHTMKFELLNGMLSGEKAPSISINKDNNRFLVSSIELTMVKKTTRGFAKFKDAEKMKSLLYSDDDTPTQAGITDITDALDTLLIGVRKGNVSRMPDGMSINDILDIMN